MNEKKINPNSQKQKRTIPFFPESIFGNPKTDAERKEVMKTIEQELKGNKNYKPNLAIHVREQLNKELLKSIHKSNWENVKELVEEGGDVNLKNKDGFTILSDVGSRGFKDIFNFLIDNGADVHGVNKDGTSVFMSVVESNQLSIADELIDKGVNIEFKDPYNRTALERIISDKSNLRVIRGTHSKTIQPIIHYLISKGADIKAKDSNGRNILMRVVSAGREQVEALELVSDDGNTKVYRPYTFRKYKVRDSKLIEYVLEKNLIDINEQDNDGQNLLSYITHKSDFDNYKELCDFVLEKGINVNPKIRNSFFSPLQYAIYNKHITLINKLIDKSAEINVNTYSTLTLILNLNDDPTKQEILEIMINRGLKIPITSIFDVGFKNYFKQFSVRWN